jgi:hypothetical protein
VCEQKKTFFERQNIGIAKGEWIFRFEAGTGRACRTAYSGPACRLLGFDRRSGCVPAEPHPPSKRARIVKIKNRLATGPTHYSPFDRTDLSSFDRTTTIERKGVESLKGAEADGSDEQDKSDPSDLPNIFWAAGLPHAIVT